MGNIYYIMGKSSSGKDTIYKEIKNKLSMLKSVTPYTTRPIRKGEVNGEEYFFIDEDKCNSLCEKGKVIEIRAYNTVHGIWKYLTADDGQIHLESESYVMIGTLESYEKMLDYFGSDVMIPIYIYVEDGERLARALQRERLQSEPKYAELCRRFIADSEDFATDKLKKAGIEFGFENIELVECIEQIILYIRQKL